MPFGPGEHLRDRRRRFGVPYTHHAIKVRDERVIEFGGSTADKAAMGIVCAPYERFATGREVEPVQHDGHAPALTVQRAEWLLSCPPPAATTAQASTVSTSPDGARPVGKPRASKRQRIFGGKYVLVDLPLLFWLAWAQRTNQRLPDWAWLIVSANIAGTFLTQYHYHGEIRRFNEHIRASCPRELRANMSR